MDFKADGSVLMVATSDLDLAFISAEDGATLPDRKGRNGTFPTVSLSYGFRGVLASLPHSGINDPLCYAASANLSLNVDGLITLGGLGVEIENASATGAPALLIDNDDVD